MQSRNRTFGALVVASAALLLAVAGILALNAAQQSAAPAPNGGLQVTIFPTLAVPVTDTPQPESIAAAPVETPLASPTPRAAQYVVQQNDTLWDIALRFGFANPDAILAANPGMNPDFLSLGQVLNIPGLDFIPPTQAAAVPEAPAEAPRQASASTVRVKSDAGGLRLRSSPVVAENVLTRLSPLTLLQVVGRSTDALWLQVTTPNATTGWVMAQYVETVAGVSVQAGQGAVNAFPVMATAAPASASVAQIEPPPYLSDISPRVADIFRAGQALGNRPNAFALIGDSNTENPKFFRPFDLGQYDLGSYAHLQDSVRFFAGSFNRVSPAARGGYSTGKLLDPGNADPSQCSVGETPVACELRITKPSIVLILVGTGDQHSWQGFEARYRQILDMTIAAGVVPILITKGDDLEHRDNNAPSGYINSVIRRMAAEYQVPLLNLTQVLDTLPARGFLYDGFHYNYPDDGRSADFTADKLIYGFNQRNLTALQALDVIRRRVIQP
jgi:LysM repeat protein